MEKKKFLKVNYGILIISSFLYFLVILFSCNPKEQNTALIEYALNDKRRHSVFIEVENKTNKYIIENANCYKYLSIYNDLSFDNSSLKNRHMA